MPRILSCVVALCVAVSPAFGQSRETGKGQGAFVIVQDAPLYKDSEGAASYGKMDIWDPVGGVQTLARMVQSYQFEEENGRVHVLALSTGGNMYRGWIERSALSSYFTYECGCGLSDARCSPHVLNGMKYKWNICFEEARETKLSELRSVPAAIEPSSQDSVETRLKKLKDLYDKGLISKEEFDAKRAEILKSM